MCAPVLKESLRLFGHKVTENPPPFDKGGLPFGLFVIPHPSFAMQKPPSPEGRLFRNVADDIPYGGFCYTGG